MNSRDFFKNSAIRASCSGDKRGVGNLPLRSASSTKALADSPVKTGDELIVIAISNSYNAQSYNNTTNYTRSRRQKAKEEASENVHIRIQGSITETDKRLYKPTKTAKKGGRKESPAAFFLYQIVIKPLLPCNDSCQAVPHPSYGYS